MAARHCGSIFYLLQTYWTTTIIIALLYISNFSKSSFLYGCRLAIRIIDFVWAALWVWVIYLGWVNAVLGRCPWKLVILLLTHVSQSILLVVFLTTVHHFICPISSYSLTEVLCEPISRLILFPHLNAKLYNNITTYQVRAYWYIYHIIINVLDNNKDKKIIYEWLLLFTIFFIGCHKIIWLLSTYQALTLSVMLVPVFICFLN